MDIVDHARCNIMCATNDPQVFFEGERIDKVDAIIPRIGASVTEHGAAVVRQFELKKVSTATRSDALLEARDKFRSLQKLSANGIGVPRSFLVSDTNDLPWLYQVLGFPLIIKLLESTHGNGVILADNSQTAGSVIDAFSSRKEKVLLQEFVKEASGEDIRAFVVGKEVVATMRRQAEKGEFRSNLNGPLIIEVNASPGLEGIETVTGIDVAGKILDLIEAKVKTARNYKLYKEKLRK